MSLTVYGIKACSSVKKATSDLDKAGVSYEFHDYKTQGIDAEHICQWLTDFGIDKVLNKRGTTWRKLTDEQKAGATDEQAAVALMVAQPSLIKRPIITGQYQGEAIRLCGYDAQLLQQMFGKSA